MLGYQAYLYAVLLVLAYLLWTAWWLRGYWQPKTQAAGADTLIAYASEGGSALKLAQQLKYQLEQQYHACGSSKSLALLTLNQLHPAQLAKAQQLLIVASTYGEGEAPDNGRLFLSRLSQSYNLSHLSFAVLALGDSSYEHYCGYGLALQQALQQQQAKPLFEPILVDRLNTEALEQWQNQLMCHAIIECVQDTSHCLAPELVHTVTLLHRQLLNPGSPGKAMYQLDFDIDCLPPWQAGDIAKLQIHGEEREYTIASLPSEKTLRLLVRLQTDEQGQAGIGSGFLCQHLTIGAQAQFVLRSNAAFHSPATDAPLILIGNGTGLAGLRAQLKEREQQGAHCNWLIYGERSPEHDRPWQQELERWSSSGHLKQLDLTYSRATPEQELHQHGNVASTERCHLGYVQHALAREQRLLKQWLNAGAVIYLCGSKKGMATDVERQLQQLLGGAELARLIEQERFKRDVY